MYFLVSNPLSESQVYIFAHGQRVSFKETHSWPLHHVYLSPVWSQVFGLFYIFTILKDVKWTSRSSHNTAIFSVIYGARCVGLDAYLAAKWFLIIWAGYWGVTGGYPGPGLGSLDIAGTFNSLLRDLGNGSQLDIYDPISHNGDLSDTRVYTNCGVWAESEQTKLEGFS